MRRWLSLVVGMLVMAMSGSLYAFSVWSDALKQQLGLTNTEATLIINVGNVGLCIATPAGLFADRFGVKVTAAMGGIMAFSGYMLFWSSVEGHITRNPVFLAVVYAIVGQGCIFSYMPALLTYQNFAKEHHGKIIGLLDCTYGLSALIMSQIYGHTWGNAEPRDQDIGAFLLFLAITTAVVDFLAVIVLKISPPPPPIPALPIDAVTSENVSESRFLLEDDEENEVYYLKRDREEEEEHAEWKLFKKVDFWLLFVMFLILQGAALTFLNNQGYIVPALSKPHDLSVTLTTIFSTCSSVSRILSGVASDVFSKHLSYGSFLSLHALVLTAVMAIFAWVPDKTMELTAAFVGVGFGGLWCIVPLLTSSLFGTKHFGFNWGTLIIASALGPLPFQPLQDWVYSSHTIPPSTDCFGAACYQWTFVVCAIACLVALMMAVAVQRRVKTAEQML